MTDKITRADIAAQVKDPKLRAIVAESVKKHSAELKKRQASVYDQPRSV